MNKTEEIINELKISLNQSLTLRQKIINVVNTEPNLSIKDVIISLLTLSIIGFKKTSDDKDSFLELTNITSDDKDLFLELTNMLFDNVQGTDTDEDELVNSSNGLSNSKNLMN